jgi:hypothetical protein
MATADECLYLPLGANVRTSENFDVHVEATTLLSTTMPGGSDGRVLSRRLRLYRFQESEPGGATLE